MTANNGAATSCKDLQSRALDAWLPHVNLQISCDNFVTRDKRRKELVVDHNIKIYKKGIVVNFYYQVNCEYCHMNDLNKLSSSLTCSPKCIYPLFVKGDVMVYDCLSKTLCFPQIKKTKQQNKTNKKKFVLIKINVARLRLYHLDDLVNHSYHFKPSCFTRVNFISVQEISSSAMCLQAA